MPCGIFSAKKALGFCTRTSTVSTISRGLKNVSSLVCIQISNEHEQWAYQQIALNECNKNTCDAANYGFHFIGSHQESGNDDRNI